MTDADPTAFFWDAAEEVLGARHVETGTMMGFPCLRVRGAFFACPAIIDSGDLVVKLPAGRVSGLVSAGAAQPSLQQAGCSASGLS